MSSIKIVLASKVGFLMPSPSAHAQTKQKADLYVYKFIFFYINENTRRVSTLMYSMKIVFSTKDHVIILYGQAVLSVIIQCFAV